jgi:general secretion pathway protein D
VHHDGDVTLELKLDVSAVGPAGFQGLPTFVSRVVTSTIRLADGETNLLAGLILDNERYGLTGVPGVADIPFIGRLFARNQEEAAQTDIVMTLTPHILRRPEITEEDLRSFLVGDDGSPPLFEVPPRPAPAVTATPTPSGETPTRPRIQPIRPPEPVPPPEPPEDEETR